MGIAPIGQTSWEMKERNIAKNKRSQKNVVRFQAVVANKEQALVC
tara:strand:+ start:260 stop:394 length:135 start_codon:yes stop_codon:yes gene_type:complete